jgi:flagellar hook assembly protein FlgD
LAIYDITGKLVKTLVDEKRESGYHSVIWNGTDENGSNVASGIYFYRIEAENHTETKSCILLK